MEFRLLGPVEAERDAGTANLGGPKQRALLALLLLNANEVISRDRLIDGLWGERAPASAGHTLEDYVSRLRKTLGAERIVTQAPGYLLAARAEEIDVRCFERNVEEGARLLSAGQPEAAAGTLGRALELWRGPALADVLTAAPFASLEAARLEDARVTALEVRLEADLVTGRDTNSVAELERLVHEHPSRERFVYLLMLALYRSGRQSEALAAFSGARARLVDDYGLEPGPALRELQAQILRQDPELAVPRARPAPSRERLPGWRRARLAAAGVVAVGLFAVAGAWQLLTRTSQATPEEATTSQVVALSTATGRVSRRAELASSPAAAASDRASVWLAEPDSGTVVRVDARSGNVVNRIPIDGGAGAVAVGGGAVWVLAVQGSAIVRVDPATAKITQRVGLGGARASALAFGRRSLWVGDPVDSALIEIDPADGAVRRVVQLALRPTSVAPAAGTIWVADYDANTVAEVDPESGRTLAAIHVGNGPSSIAVGAGGVWVANSLDSTVSRIDPARGIVVATTPVGSGPAAVTVTGGSVWTADRFASAVSRIDPSRNSVVASTAIGGEPTTLAAVENELWVGLEPHGTTRGGTLRLLSSSPLAIDPAVQVQQPPPQSGGLTTDGLVSYNHVGGAGGLQLVPDLAVALPTPTDGGRTYTFRLRPGIRYSDGRVVRASDFTRAFMRLFWLRPTNTDSFRGIIGSGSCTAATAECDFSRGIVTDDAAGTVTFHLSTPDPDFLTTLTYGSLSAPVPPGTPLHRVGFHPIPGTGPYMVARASRREILYVRNPHFREWSNAAQPDGNPDRIVMRFGLSAEEEVRAIESGRADWMLDAVPAELLPALQRRYARQLHTYAIPQTDWLQLNTTRVPFDDIRVRQALNLAIDRRVAVRTYGGPAFATVTCQLLPPGVAGYRRYCPYTRTPRPAGTWTAPDLRRARRLVEESGTAGAQVVVSGWTDDCCLRRPFVEYTARVLRRLGYRATTRYISHASLAGARPSVYRSIQIIPNGWTDPTADNFLSTWISCSGAGNNGWFCAPGIDHRIQQAKTLGSSDPRTAAAQWASIDREIVDRAVAVPLFNERWIEFTSARLRNFQHNPNWGFLAAQAAVG